MSFCSLRQKLSKEKAFFSKLHDKYCQNARNPLGIVNIPFCDVITKIRTFLFLASRYNMKLVSGIRNYMIRNKNYIYFYINFTSTEVAWWKEIDIRDALNSLISIHLFLGHITETRFYEEVYIYVYINEVGCI